MFCNPLPEGVSATSNEVLEMAKRLCDANTIEFQGLYSHCGNSYYAQSKSDVQKIADDTVAELLAVVQR